MNPSEFLDVAKLISGPSGLYPLGRQRSAISRAYYAAFLDARDRLNGLAKFSIPKKSAHDAVWRAFAFSDEPLKTVGRLLQDLKKMREVADYEMTRDDIQNEVAEALRISRDIQVALASADLSGVADPTYGRSGS